MIDNFRILETFFDRLKDPEDFYFVQVLQRKKDGVELPSYTSGARVIRCFYFYTKEEFLKQETYIKNLCKDNNARAYFWINPRNSFDVACESIKQFTELIQSGNIRQGVAVYDRATGASRSNKYEKLWIVDLDSLDPDYIIKVTELINQCRGKEENKIRDTIPTKNGIHLITTGFDRNQFAQLLALNQMDKIDIHNDNPTLLYYNE